MEHLQHFGLKQDPFSNEPDLRFYFESASHRDAQRRVERGLRQQKGLTLLIGDGGMGKTLLARRVLETLEEEVFEATLLVMLPGAADATGILQRFARQLGCEEPATDRAGLLGQIYEHLAIVREDGRHAVLMIDDAQIMTPEVFAELAGLLNLEYEDRRLISMLFVGSPELDRLVQNDPSILPRVDVRVTLAPLDLPNATDYLTHRLEAVSGDPAILPPAAIETLFKFGRGRPRLLNTLADNALFEAYLGDRTAIDPSDVERAAADLGIGPDPGTTYGPLAAAPGPPAPVVPENVPVQASAPPSPAASNSPSPPSAVLPGAPVPPSAVVASAAAEPVARPSLDLDLEEPAEDFELAPEMPAAAVTPTLDLDQGLEAVLEETPPPAGSATSDADALETLAEEPAIDALEFDVEPPAVTQYPLDPPVPDAAAPTPRPAPLAEDEILDAEMEPLDGFDDEPIEDAFVELIEE